MWSQEDCVDLFFWVVGWGGVSLVKFCVRVVTVGCSLSFTSSLPLGRAFMSKIPLLPCRNCSITQILLSCPRALSQEKSLRVGSGRALLGSAGQRFPVVGVSTDWAAAIMLRFYCFVFIFSIPPPCQLLKKHSRVAGCLVMACFPAELSHAVATCWKPLLVPEDVFLWQQQSHFLTDNHSVPLKWFTSLWWCFSFCRIIAFLWPKSAPVYCSSFKQGRQSCGALNLAFVEPVKSGIRCKILSI